MLHTSSTTPHILGLHDNSILLAETNSYVGFGVQLQATNTSDSFAILLARKTINGSLLCGGDFPLSFFSLSLFDFFSSFLSFFLLHCVFFSFFFVFIVFLFFSFVFFSFYSLRKQYIFIALVKIYIIFKNIISYLSASLTIFHDFTSSIRI